MPGRANGATVSCWVWRGTGSCGVVLGLMACLCTHAVGTKAHLQWLTVGVHGWVLRLDLCRQCSSCCSCSSALRDGAHEEVGVVLVRLLLALRDCASWVKHLRVMCALEMLYVHARVGRRSFNSSLGCLQSVQPQLARGYETTTCQYYATSYANHGCTLRV